ncbi:hypothetical protein [Streptosporangium sp. CA-115845]|uniref:hypothetical protein n=1 Tax=Streptosporangium sp. CA-115845 TaxID=3240071 RepID=UPI003D8A8F5B
MTRRERRPRLMVLSHRSRYGEVMSANALEIRLREGSERIDLARYTDTLTQVQRALNEIDHVFAQRKTVRPAWIVQDLGHDDQELVVRLSARKTPRRDHASLLASIDALVSGVEQLQETPEVPQYYTATTVERLLRIGKPGNGVQEVSLATVNDTAGPHFPVSEPVREHARLAMTGTQVSLGSVAGWIDQMSVRRLNKGVSSVSLFDPSTRRAVLGRLPAEMQAVVESMWRRRVLARGTVWRNDHGQVVKIDIEHLEPLPEEPATPAPVAELLGIAPDWLGGQSVDDHIREARRA